MKNTIKEYAKNLFDECESHFYRESIKAIKTTNGNKKDSPRACKSSSSVYILYSSDDEVLYVGETGESVKTRCFGDGSGSHDRKIWFVDVDYVQHFTCDSESELSTQERKLLEQAFSIYLSPKYYG